MGEVCKEVYIHISNDAVGTGKVKVKFCCCFVKYCHFVFLSAILIFIFIFSWDTIHHDFQQTTLVAIY